MKRNNRIILAIVCLALAALACNAVTGGGGGDTPGAPSTPSPQVILSDDFSSAQWGTGTDADSSVEYANGALQMIVYTKNYLHKKLFCVEYTQRSGLSECPHGSNGY
jgi:hypothetical protein